VRLSADTAELADLGRHVGEELDQRLSRKTARPVAVALSGGGDSLALALCAEAWAKAAGRRLLILTVDHRLQAASAGWTRACGAHAARLGAEFRPLAWTGDKPDAGVPAAARAARHRLIAQAAREAGARVVLMGHTADDVLEARAMRAAGSTTPEPRIWAPSPAWPEGRGLFLLRPLLGVRRAEIRAWLTARGEAWIDDPANEDLRYARARARAAGRDDPAAPEPAATPDALGRACRMDAAGGLSLSREALRSAPAREAAALVGIACLCAAGTVRPPAAARVRALLARLQAPDPLTATLAGARIEADGLAVRFLREAGEAARGGLPPLRLAAGETAVWDGRFEVTAAEEMELRPLAGLAAQLAPQDRDAVSGLPVRARPTLPVGLVGDEVRLVHARPLALERLRAACGLIAREPD